jgi:geranylgeranyl diphosphate synthase type I
VLNITESRLAKGKGGVGDDIKEGKITLLVIRTLERANEHDRAKLVEILKSHTDDRGKISEAISIIDRYGAKEYAKELSARLVSGAWKELDALLPQSEAKDRIRQISEFLIGRNI